MTETFAKAQTFIYRNARPLDLARWQYHFENGSPEAVLRALAAYQNPDGGFAHALEPDAWSPESSPIQTWAATEIIRELGTVEASHPIVQGIIKYLASNEHFDGRTWANTIPSNNDHPHAPWWGDSEDRYQTYNPTAALAGFLLCFAEEKDMIFAQAERIAIAAVDHLLSRSEEKEMHVLACYVALLDWCERSGRTLPFDTEGLATTLDRFVAGALTQDLAAWETGYICKPSAFFNRRTSRFYQANQQLAAYECDFIRRTQEADGSWPTPWTWADYPIEWSISRNWWKGHIALSNLLFIKGIEQI